MAQRLLRSAAILAGLAIMSCGTEPNGAILDGRWGGPGLEIVANARGAQVSEHCANALFFAPLQLNSAGELDVRGTFRSISWHQAFRLRAALRGDRLEVYMTRFDGGGGSVTGHYTLTAGAAPDFSRGVICSA
jgi:hypothetical protein